MNHDLIASGKVQQHMNAVGGEDRLWLGPEGGQYSIFFAPGASFDLDHWYTPRALDTEPFEVVSRSATSVAIRRRLQLTNYSGTHFDVQIGRVVKLLDSSEIDRSLGMQLTSAKALAPQASVEHTQRTIHIVGPERQLDQIAEKVLGAQLSAVTHFSKAVFAK